MDITAHHASHTATKPFNLAQFDDSDKENFSPQKAPPRPILPHVPTRSKIHSSRRVTVKRPRPRGFEPWGPHADFLSPPPRPKISRPLPRCTVANLTNTPPRPSYAERVKGIFASPSPTRHVEEMSRGDLPLESVSRGMGEGEMGAAAQEDGVKMHLRFKDDSAPIGPAGEDTSEQQSTTAMAEENDNTQSSPLTSESALERRLDNLALASPTKKQKPASVAPYDSGPKETQTPVVSSTSPAPSTHCQDFVYDPRRFQHTIPQINVHSASIYSNPIRREEDESSDAWTDDSQFLPSRAERRERKRRRQRMQQAGNINRDRFLHHPDVPRSDMLSPKGMKIAQKAGLLYAKHPLSPGNRAGTIPAQENNLKPRAWASKPSRFTVLASRRSTIGVQVQDEPSTRLSENSLPKYYRSSDADDEDSDPDA